MPDDFAKRVIPAAPRRLDRLALITFTTALSVAACGAVVDDGKPGQDRGIDPPTTADSGPLPIDNGGPGPMYGGGIPYDAGHFDAGHFDSGAPGPMYGLPADAGHLDSGSNNDGAVRDDGGMAVLYGLPMWDAGAFDE